MAQLTAVPDGQVEAPHSPWYELPGEKVAASLQVDPAHGLSSGEAASRGTQYGPIKFAEAKTEPR
jgi:Ca2+-transporting ATPase